MREKYLKTAVALRTRLDRLRARLPERDERGVTSLEVAVFAAVLLGLAIAIAALITAAVNNHDSTIK